MFLSLHYPNALNPLNTHQEPAPSFQNQPDSEPVRQLTYANTGDANQQPSPNANDPCTESGPTPTNTKKKSFQGIHVLDLDHDMRPSKNPRTFDTEDVNISSKELTVPHDLATRIVDIFTVESYALLTSINLLSERRLEVHTLVSHLKALIPSSSLANQAHK
ncbi:uncharacterized protein E6C27_scaffold538G00790 [Cucumis melo var. makuwa]|uniref:Uncharacterized protein n=1 Tax=Cucumis melo var. makuwa TaxID=1194695 RepID=A0A5A7VFB9_CUCMM|nr:uncharacterized protein E6C27_scaffold538G00790 [Cucumis melo var. makuwa]